MSEKVHRLEKHTTIEFVVGELTDGVCEIQARFSSQQRAEDYVRLLRESKKYVEVVVELRAENAKMREALECSLMSFEQHLTCSPLTCKNTEDAQTELDMITSLIEEALKE